MKLSHIVLVAIIAITYGCTEINRAKTYLLPPTALGMEEVAPKLFVNKEMSPAQRAEISKFVPEARSKIADFYGSVLSNPVILACSTEECFVSLGGVTARALDLGESLIFLSPRGLTIPLLTHEWSHAELRVRMGGFFGMCSIPTWFDEGLAVVVSEEPTHSEKVWEEIVAAKITSPKLEDLVSLKEWNKAVKQFGGVDRSKDVTGKISVVYATAGHEVRKWHQRVGREGLLKFIKQLKSGGDFAGAFGSIGQHNSNF